MIVGGRKQPGKFTFDLFQMTLVSVSGSPSPREVRMTTWYGEQSGTDSLLHSQPKNPGGKTLTRQRADRHLSPFSGSVSSFLQSAQYQDT